MFNAELCHDTHSYLPQAVIAAAVAFSMSLAAAAGTTWHVSVSTEGNQASCSNPEFFCCSIYSCTTTLVFECRDTFGGRPPWLPSATLRSVTSSTHTCFHPAKTSLPVCSAARLLAVSSDEYQCCAATTLCTVTA